VIIFILFFELYNRSILFIMHDHLSKGMNKTSLLLLTAPIILTLVAPAIPLHAFSQAICRTGGTAGAGGLGGAAGKAGMNSDGIVGQPGSSISGANGTNLNGTGNCRPPS
jgi:hypothetical protein